MPLSPTRPTPSATPTSPTQRLHACPTYLGWAAALVTLCWPAFWAGIPAVVHAGRAESLLAAGDLAGAQRGGDEGQDLVLGDLLVGSAALDGRSDPGRPHTLGPSGYRLASDARTFGPSAEGWRSLVDRTGLENRQAARSQGFESPPLRHSPLKQCCARRQIRDSEPARARASGRQSSGLSSSERSEPSRRRGEDGDCEASAANPLPSAILQLKQCCARRQVRGSEPERAQRTPPTDA